MKILYPLFSILLFTTFVSCDKDSDDDDEISCNKEVVFEIGEAEICATGTYLVTTTSFPSTNISLQGDNDEILLINFLGGSVGQIAIPPGNASYVNQEGKTYTSLNGGTINITSIDESLNASFNFSAQATDNEVVLITNGSIEALPSR